MRKQAVVRRLVRGACLAGAAFLAAGGPLPPWTARVFPGLSPLVLTANAIAGRTWYFALFWLAPPVLLLAAAVWRGRWFCRWVCPAGTLHSAAGRLGPGKRIIRRRWNGLVFWAIFGSSVTGVSVLLFLDPLATWNRFTVFWGGANSVAAIVPGLVLPALLVLSAVQPAVWCTHFCPLGYLLETVGAIRQTPKPTFDRVRRDVLAGLTFGVPAAVLWKHVPLPGIPRTAKKGPPLLPPGAGNPERFGDLCTRCYACVNVCPTGMIRVRTAAGESITGLFHPVLDADRGFCDQFCKACSEVCPAGAILPLALEEKQNLQIGIAEVRRDACLAWADREYCMVCQEVCPYQAVETDWGPNNLARPVVNPSACRGCGFCQHECPAERAGKAIVVRALPEQVALD